MTYIWPTGRRVELLIQFALKHSLRFISFQLFCYFAITALFATLPLSLSLSHSFFILLKFIYRTACCGNVVRRVFSSTSTMSERIQLLVWAV